MRKRDRLKVVYDICGIKEFNRVAIRKINIIEFSPPSGNKSESMNFLPIVFNNALIENLLVFPRRDIINQGLTNLHYDAGNDQMNFQYGLLPANQKTKRPSVMLDIDIYNVEPKFQVKNLESKLNSINQEIFNIFNWAIGEESKIFLNTKVNG